MHYFCRPASPKAISFEKDRFLTIRVWSSVFMGEGIGRLLTGSNSERRS